MMRARTSVRKGGGAALLVFLAIAAHGCRSYRLTERWTEPGWGFSENLQNVAVLEPVVERSPAVVESPLMLPVYPLAYAAQLFTLHFPEAAPDPRSPATLAFLREVLASHLESVGLHAIRSDDADRIIKNKGSLVEAGADYVLHTKITRWDRGYIIIHSWVRVEIEFQLVRMSDGAVVWDGSVANARQAGLLQYINIASAAQAAPVSGVPVGQISALTGPLARLRGNAFGDLLQDAALGLAQHIGPSPLDPCNCEGCSARRETQRSGAPGGGNGSAVAEAYVVGVNPKNSAAGANVFYPGEIIEVVALAPEEAIVSFALGGLHHSIPMAREGRVERAGAPLALYRGSLVADARDAGENISIFVTASGAGLPRAAYQIATAIAIKSGGGE